MDASTHFTDLLLGRGGGGASCEALYSPLLLLPFCFSMGVWLEVWGRGIMGRAPMEVLSGRVPTSEIEEEAVERDLPRKSREAGERERGLQYGREVQFNTRREGGGSIHVRVASE